MTAVYIVRQRCRFSAQTRNIRVLAALCSAASDAIAAEVEAVC
jgi:hypothetical protein